MPALRLSMHMQRLLELERASAAAEARAAVGKELAEMKAALERAGKGGGGGDVMMAEAQAAA